MNKLNSSADLIQLIKEKANSFHAVDMGNANLAKPIKENELKKGEDKLGFELPELLKQIYKEVGNGGFGPGYGFIGFQGGTLLDTGDAIDELYNNFRKSDPDDPSWSWPEKVLPICHWGDAMYSCIDCSKAPYRVIRFDPNGAGPSYDKPWKEAFIKETDSFKDWIEKWIEGKKLFKIS